SIMRRLRGEGLAILFVTHFLNQVYAVSDRITVLRNGTLVGEFLTAELPRLQLISVMLGRTFEEVKQLKSPPETGVEATFLQASGIGKRGFLNPIDLKIGAGEVVGLAGLLGSGRTETAKLLFGVERPDTGQLRVEGKPAEIDSPRCAVRRGLAFS